MWELIAISTETNRVWRWRVQGRQLVRLGRCPKAGWAAPWDMRISSEHAELHFEDDHVRVVRLPTARNAIHFRGVPANEFLVCAGEEFRIGLTTFRLYAVQPSEQPSPVPAPANAALQSSDTTPGATGKASLKNDLEAVLNLIDQGLPQVDPPAHPTDTRIKSQESTTRTPAAFAKLVADHDTNSQIAPAPTKAGPAEAPAVHEREQELEILRAKLSSIEDALQSELKARLEAEQQAARIAQEANERLAAETRLREAEGTARRQAEEFAARAADEAARQLAEEKQRREQAEHIRREAERRIAQFAEEAERRRAEEAQRRDADQKTRQELESQLKKAREEATRQQEELESRLAALNEAHRFRDEADNLKSELDRLQSQLAERIQLHREAESQIRDLVSVHEHLMSTESNRRQLDAEKMRQAEDSMAKRAAEADRLRQEMEALQNQLAEKMGAQQHAEEMAQRYAEEEQRWRQREEQLRSEIEQAHHQAEEEVKRHRQDAEAVKAELAMLRLQLEQSAVDQQNAEEVVRQLVGQEQQRAVEAELRREAELQKRSEMEAEALRRRNEAELLAEQVAALNQRMQEQVELQRRAEHRAGQMEQQHSIESLTLRDELRKLQEQAEAKSEVAALARQELDHFLAVEQQHLAQERAERMAAEQARLEAESEARKRREELEQLQRHVSDLQSHWQRDSEAQRRAEEEAERWRNEALALKEGLKALEARVAETHQAAPRPIPKRRTSVTEGEFDPYYRWLAIPPEEQPPDYYRLLGLARFEDNLEIIESAADRQMDFVRRQHSGKHGHLSQKLLNELSRARLCLRDRDKKRVYDEALWSELESAQAPMVVSSQNAAMVSQSLDGSAFREYSLLDYIAETRHGHVFKANHRTLGRLVAMTVQADAAAHDPQLALRFRLKALVLARAKHPFLLKAFDAGHQQNLQYLVTEYIDGGHLVDLLKQYGALPVSKAVNYVAQAAQALHYLHERGVVHRNVKPSNILLSSDSTVRVVGIGSSFYKRSSVLGDEAMIDELEEPWPSGSLDYMSPEQAENSAMVGRRADIYSLGCTLFTLLTRRLLFPFPDPELKQRAHREHPVPSLTVFRNDVPDGLDHIFQKMVSKTPGRRYDTMQAVISALRECGFEFKEA